MRALWLLSATPDYQGRRVHSPPGVQEAAIELLLRQDPPRGSVLDVASGSGAMLARLSEAGFEDLQAVARDPAIFGESEGSDPAEEAPYRRLDLNEDFSAHYDHRFGLVVSSETIEHLRSPTHLLEQASLLVEEGGFLLVTTPNVASWIGRLRFLISGELRWFDRDLARRLGHISPVTDTQMRMLLPACGFELVATTSAGSYSGWLRKLVTAPLALPFVAFSGRRGWGDCNIYLARKSGVSAS